MADKTNEISVWQDGAPVINVNSNQEFDVWQDAAPVVTIDETQSSPTPPTTSGRRRAFIF